MTNCTGHFACSFKHRSRSVTDVTYDSHKGMVYFCLVIVKGWYPHSVFPTILQTIINVRKFGLNLVIEVAQNKCKKNTNEKIPLALKLR